MTRFALLPLGFALALGACDPAPTTAPVANDAAVNATANAAAPAGPQKLTAFPEEYRGRWGMTPADCKGGAGLMTVAASTLSFNAGVKATAKDMLAVRPDRLTATLDYTNRKGNWTSPTTMTLQDDGKALLREDARPSGMFRYQRCAG
jgi:hypothetical protein